MPGVQFIIFFLFQNGVAMFITGDPNALNGLLSPTGQKGEMWYTGEAGRITLGLLKWMKEDIPRQSFRVNGQLIL